MESQGRNLNIVNRKCSWFIILIHIYEKTSDNPAYIFTSVDIYDAYGCDPHSAIQIINKGVLVGTFVRIREIQGKPYHFKLTNKGIKNAERLIRRQLAEDKEDEIYGR